MQPTAGSPVTAAVTPPLSPLALHTRWASRTVVGRPLEQAAVRQELAAAQQGRLAALTFEGEPGIGKTRLLAAAAGTAEAEGFVAIAVTADEELRGPFLLARSLLAAREAHEAADDAVRTALGRALDVISGREDADLATLSPDQELLRAFDLAAVAIRALAEHHPLALLIDDLQWGDEDSVRMLRYIVRSAGDVPLFLLFALRPEEMEAATEVRALLADMQRMGFVRRLQIARFSQTETTELLKHVLQGAVDPASAATMHAQAEGVPFILEELARTYRDNGLVQQIDGVWRLTKKADRLVPSAVRTLIERRAAHLPAEVRELLAEAAVVGRAFSVRDLQAVRGQMAVDGADDPSLLAETLRPAVDAGLLAELPEGAAADYRFNHEQVREFAAGTLSAPRRRAIHAAIVDLLSGDGEPSPESLPLLAQHALAAGDNERAARFACEAAQAALDARAPEEVLRIVEMALPAISRAQDRVALLRARDDALGMLRRPVERLESLAELGALAEALADRHLAFDTMLRRASVLRLLEDEDGAAQLARDVLANAEGEGDQLAALSACLELGQALVGKTIGESFSPPGDEADLDQAAAAYERAVELAIELGDRASLAAATRELGVIDIAHARNWFVEQLEQGGLTDVREQIAAGESIEVLVADTPIAPVINRAQERFSQAVDLYDELGDRRGLMSSVIAMAYIPFALDIHLRGSAKSIEEIRRLATSLDSLTRESDRDRAEAQMLYGVHVFARAKGVADVALSRGVDAYAKSRVIGDPGLEFAAAGGVALAHLDLGELPQAVEWFDRAAATAAASPSAYRTRQLELWRGVCCAADGEGAGMRQHFERAVELATGAGRPAARCEALAQQAVHSAALGERLGEPDLLDRADAAALEAGELAKVLPGIPLWAAQALAARTRVALVRDRPEEAVEHARAAMGILIESKLDDLNLDIVLPAARAIAQAGSPEEQGMISMHLRQTLALVAQRIEDEDARIRWFRGPLGRELSELAGPLDIAEGTHAESADADGRATLADEDAQVLHMLVEGRTNREIATALGVEEDAVAGRLARFYAQIGTSSRAGATAFALRR